MWNTGVLAMNLSEKNHSKNELKDDNIEEIYDCDENPLAYMIEPKAEVDIIPKDYKTTPEDLEHVLE